MASVDTRSFSSDSDSSKCDEIGGKLSEDLGVKLEVITTQKEKLPENDRKQDGEAEEEEEEEEGEEEEEEEEFSFVCVNTDGSSPVSADVVFQNGIITPAFPLFGRQLFFSDDEDSKTESSDAIRPPLRKVFVEDSRHYRDSESDEPEGPYCVWTREAVEASPEACKKSNSTGFSKLWKFRALVPRSNSDGKDAFVFLRNPKHTSKKTEKNAKAATQKEKKKTTAVKTVKNDGATAGKTASSAHEQHYVANRKMKEEDKRKSYLPYRPDIVGIFTNVSGLSRNVHPF